MQIYNQKKKKKKIKTDLTMNIIGVIIRTNKQIDRVNVCPKD